MIGISQKEVETKQSTNNLASNIYLKDCIEGMKGYPDKYFDLAIVDPPYGLPERSGQDGGKLKNRIIQKMHQKGWDIAPNISYFNEVKRVSKNQIIWGGNYFNLGPARCTIVWDKCQPWENFSQVEIAWTSFDSTASLFKFDNRTGDKIHPTQKPIALYEWILKNYAKEGDLILDTHGGSMSSVIACLKNGFNITCFEIDEEYYNKAKKRIEDFLIQGNLFMEKPKINFIQN